MSRKDQAPTSLEADRALFDGHVQGLVVTICENERPPCGLAGLIDWYFHGAISHCIRKGAITGKIGECTYFPLTKNGVLYHLVLAGVGHSSDPGIREEIPMDTLKNLQKNLIALKIPQMGLSKADFGEMDSAALTKNLKGVPLWIGP
jgi:hypothetical protein